MSSAYWDIYHRWEADPVGFWEEPGRQIDWFKEPETIFDPEMGIYGRWFTGGTCNTSYNCLDRQIAAGRGDQIALIHDSAMTGSKAHFSYRETLRQVNALAAVLADKGITKGDRVIIYMPMVPEAAFAMLACARLGAIHSVVFGGFSARELATRIDDATPKAVIAGSCGLEPGRIVDYKPMLDGAIEMASSKPEFCIILQRPQREASLVEGRDFDYRALVDPALAAGRTVEPAHVATTDPLYILYTSGTTGQPKGVVRDNGSHMVAVKWTMEHMYGVKPGEVFWGVSDVGWVVGHSYIVYGPLLHGATGILFEGKPVGTPDAGTFWRVMSEHKVVSQFTAPTAFRAIKQADPDGLLVKNYDLSHFRTLYLAGERADPDTIHWAERHLGVPVLDHWWQTETGWPMVGNQSGPGLMPVKYGSPGLRLPGYKIDIVDDHGMQVGPDVMGNIVVRMPLPPGCLPTLWNADQRFIDAYLTEFPGYYKTADAGYKDEDGYLYIMARTDDIINVAGHRLSTGAMEEVIAEHPDVAECAVIGMADQLKGQLPCGFIVLNAGVNRPEGEIEAEVVSLVREKIGPVAAFRTAIAVKRLPKTRSGKILRSTMQKVADSQAWSMPATIDDPEIMEEIAAALAMRGIGGGVAAAI
ncbi:MAG: AMP-binding protein [Notoacmeibacter sp.]|nr:AMP-binding protein [Notoacmeibacter sp.]MCC0032764.1 AMP-binding protein [Brucellaceae bacterium]